MFGVIERNHLFFTQRTQLGHFVVFFQMRKPSAGYLSLGRPLRVLNLVTTSASSFL